MSMILGQIQGKGDRGDGQEHWGRALRRQPPDTKEQAAQWGLIGAHKRHFRSRNGGGPASSPEHSTEGTEL